MRIKNLYLFHNFQNYDLQLIFQDIGKYNFKKFFISAIEKYMKFIKPGLPLVFIASVHFLNNSLHNLVKILMYQIYLRKKDFFPMFTGIALKT